MRIYLLLITVFCLNLNSRAELINPNTHKIISDVFVDSIPEGKCLVQGKVLEAESQNPVEYAFIGTVQRDFYTHSKRNGEYQFLMDAKETGIYFHHFSYGELVIENYDFKSQHCVTIVFKTPPAVERQITVEKPVIYLYADHNTNVELSLVPKGSLTFSYPQYEDGWKVKVTGKGTLQVNNQEYPYLFWEGDYEGLNFSPKDGLVSGYYINTDSTIQFMENVLTKAGLNTTEKTDFITYWAPRMMQYRFATIQFLLNEDYAQSIATLSVNPLPKSQLRIFMLFQGHHENLTPNFLVEPSWPIFKRQGLTLVEWGGAELLSN